MRLYTVYLYLETALHFSDGTSTHHQERIQLIYNIWYLSDRYCYHNSLNFRLVTHKARNFVSHSTFIEAHEGAVTSFLTLLHVQ